MNVHIWIITIITIKNCRFLIGFIINAKCFHAIFFINIKKGVYKEQIWMWTKCGKMAEINFSIGNAELLIKDWNRRTNSMKRHFNCQMNPKYFHLRIIVRSLNRICNYAIFFQRNSSNQEVRYFPYSANDLLESSWRTTTTTGDLRWADGKPIFINLNRNKNLSFFFL